MRQALLLADLEAQGLVRLEVGCNRCPRRGAYAVARLIERHGRDVDLVRLCLRLASDCPSYRTGQGTPRGGARFPQLPGLFLT